MTRAFVLPAVGLLAGAALVALVPGGSTAPEADASRIAPAAASAPQAPAAPALAGKLDAALARLGAADPARPLALASALRDLEAALAEYGAGLAGADETLGALEHALRRDEAAIKRLLAAIIASERLPGAGDPDARAPHPAGPVAAARSERLLATAREALAAGANDLAVRLDALAETRGLRDQGREAIETALEEAELARTMLHAAQAEAPSLPDAASGQAIIAARSASLTDLARAVAQTGPVSPPSTGAEAAAEEAIALLSRSEAILDAAEEGGQVILSSRGPTVAGAERLEPPVAGRVLRGFEVADAAGVVLPGLTFAAPPRSLVTAPLSGEVRYVGPFLDYGTVVAVASAQGGLVLLAGLAETLVAPGAQVAAGTPLGLLGGRALSAREYLMLPLEGKDPLGAETLYMEFWRAGRPVDPAPWLGAGTVAGLAAQNG